ncbi:hypothetical protein V2G26_011372 [Clonostachys chloroleuca]
MSAPLASKVLRRAPVYSVSKKDCQDWPKFKTIDSSKARWGENIACLNFHVRTSPLSNGVLSGWEFVTTVENAERKSTFCWVDKQYRAVKTILPWKLSWDRFQDSIKEARGGSFPEDLVLRLPWVADPLKASTEFEWHMSMAAAEFFITRDHRMWCCKQQPPTIVVCRAKEFRTLVDQGWTALMRKLKEGKLGDANGKAQSKDAESDSYTDSESDDTTDSDSGSITDSNVAQGHDLQVNNENSNTEDVVDATVGDGGGDGATETTTTTTTTINNPTNSTTTTTNVNNPTATTSTTIITTVAGGGTTTNTTTTTTSTKRKNKTRAESRDGGSNKRPRGSTTRAK